MPSRVVFCLQYGSGPVFSGFFPAGYRSRRITGRSLCLSRMTVFGSPVIACESSMRIPMRSMPRVPSPGGRTIALRSDRATDVRLLPCCAAGSMSSLQLFLSPVRPPLPFTDPPIGRFGCAGRLPFPSKFCGFHVGSVFQGKGVRHALCICSVRLRICLRRIGASAGDDDEANGLRLFRVGSSRPAIKRETDLSIRLPSKYAVFAV